MAEGRYSRDVDKVKVTGHGGPVWGSEKEGRSLKLAPKF